MVLQVQFIENEKLQKATFRKRERTLKKNTCELATLCDIPALMVCFGPDQQVSTWPENDQEIRDIINKYRRLSPHESSKHKFALPDYLEKKKMKRCHGPREKSDEMSCEAAKEAIRSVDSKLQAIDDRIQFLVRQNCQVISPVSQAEPAVTSENGDNTEAETIGTSQNCEENVVDSPIAKPISEVAPNENDEQQNLGFGDAYGQLINYWGAQMAMNPYLQYPYVPFVFVPPLMGYQPPPLAVAPPPQMGFMPFPMPFGMSGVDSNTAEGENGE